MSRSKKTPPAIESGRFAVIPLLAILLLFHWQDRAWAASSDESTTPQSETKVSANAALDELKRENSEGSDTSSGLKTSRFALDAQSHDLVLERFRRYQKHQIAALEHRERVFEWQLISNKVSFVVVLVLVFSGIAFSAIQFWKAMRLPIDKLATASDSEFSAGAGGITVRSSVLGVIVLVISLAFFYLYLVHVFPIEELEPVKDSQVEVLGSE